MKTKITSLNVKLNLIKACLFLWIFSFNSIVYAQITANPIMVDSVYPKRVTTNSIVTIAGLPSKPNNKNLGSIKCENIFNLGVPGLPRGGFKRDPNNNNGLMTIEKKDLEPGNDVILKPLLINGESVHEGPGPATITNQVFLTYVAPSIKNLTIDSPYLVNEIFTNWNYNERGFWSSEDGMQPAGSVGGLHSPDDYHQLLGYRVGPWPGSGSIRTGKPTGTIYSTGVNDKLLKEKLTAYYGFTLDDFANPDKYKQQVFKAYSSFGISGDLISHPDPGKNSYLLAGDRIEKDPITNQPLVGSDEKETDDISSFTDINGLTVFDAITNGKNGLELGTAVANINKNIDIKFYSGNGTNGTAGDSTPDLLVTQMALPNGYDTYYYTDKLGNVIGRPIRLYISNNGDRTRLAYWNTDSYSYPFSDFASATPDGRAYTSPLPQYKPIYMAALRLDDFEIEDNEVSGIEKVVMKSDGAADIAFLAYNRSSFNIEGPVVKPLLTKYVCNVDEEYSVTFELEEGENVGIDDGEGNIIDPDPSYPLTYQWLKNNIPIDGQTSELLTITDADPNSLGTYKVRIGNTKGNIIMQVDLLEGGYPYIWDADNWKLSPAYVAEGYEEIANKDRRLIFASDYPGVNEVNGVLEGCDCFIANETNVVIKDGQTLKLHGAVNVAPEVVAAEGFDPKDAGTLTLENNANLIQAKDVDVNVNFGDVLVKRDAVDLKKYDYVFWSSPVVDGKMSMIQGETGHMYKWETNEVNAKGTRGDWVRIETPSSTIMSPGRGYIKRVNGEPVINSEFYGVPNNGVIEVPIYMSDAIVPDDPNLNLLGNPYPSAISAEEFLTINTNLLGHVDIWTHDSGPDKNVSDPFYGDFKLNYSTDNYARYNKTGSTDGRFAGYIASGQGFFVTATSPGTIRFTNEMRFDELKNGYNNTQFYRESSSEQRAIKDFPEKQLIWLSLSDESKSATVTLLGYVDGASMEEDRLYDSRSIKNGKFRIYSTINDIGMIIQGLPLPFSCENSVELGVEILKNGIYSIGIDQLKGSHLLDDDQPIYLEDTYNSIIHNLKIAPYSFTATAGDCKDRFILRYTSKMLSVEDQELSKTFVYIKNDKLIIKASNMIESVQVYDLTGKKLIEHKLNTNSDNFNVPFQYAKGAYVTVINFNNGSSLSKKIIN